MAVINGTAGNDTLTGTSGNDDITGGAGNDTVTGGAGQDVARYSGIFAEYTVTWDAGTRKYTIVDTVGGRDGTDVVSGVELFQFFDTTRDWGNLTSGSGDGIVARGTVGSDTMSGSPGYDTLFGGEGNDSIDGGTGSDLIYGESGNDQLTGGGGDDTIEGNGGFDVARFTGSFAEYNITWSAATRKYTIVDTVAGRDGTDVVSSVELFQFFDSTRDWGNLTVGSGDGLTINGGAGNDTLFGSAGYDTISGRSGNDTIDAGTGDDVIFGEAGNDQLTGGAGNDTIDGGTDFDLVRFTGAYSEYNITWNAGTRKYTVTDTVAGRDGTDVVGGVELFQFFDTTRDWGNLTSGSGDGIVARGTVGSDTMFGSPGYDTLYGGEGNDSIDAGTGNDVIYGESGNDQLTGGGGDDTIEGNGGFDVARFTGSFAEYNITWSAATRKYTIVDTVAGRDGTDVVSSVELFQFFDSTRDWGNLTVGSGDGLTINGGTGNDTIFGSAGYDTLSGRGGNDTIEGGTGDDVIFGEAGNDQLTGGAGNDTIDGGTDFDLVRFTGAYSEYNITWNAGSRKYTVTDTVAGRDGTDVVGGVELFQFFDTTRDWGNLVAGAGDGLVLRGTAGNDTMFGSAGYDTLYGGEGNDTIETGAGNDLIYGEGGNDQLTGAGGDDTIEGNGGFDLVRFTGSFSEYNISWNGSTRKYTIVDTVGGRDGTDVVSSVELFQFFDGTRDWGNLTVGSGDGLTINGGAGNDTIFGSAGYDTLSGRSGNDTIEGGAGDDAIFGEAGNDQLTGGFGNDTIDGGADFDVARFTGAYSEYNITWSAATRKYTVTDTVAGRDGIDLVSNVELFQFFDGTRDWGNLVPGAGDGLVLRGTVGNDTMYGSPGYDTLYGGEGNDTIDGNAGNDVIYGESGNDQITGGAGDDAIEGNGGFDIARFTGSFAEYNITWNPATRKYTIIDSVSNRDGSDTVGSVELFQFFDGTRDWGNLTAGSGDGLTLNGGAGNDTLFGSAGYDTISGRSGNDMIEGGTGNDVIFGEAGNDQLIGGAGNDTIDGGTDFDLVRFTGAFSEYNVTWDAASRKYTVADTVAGRDGTDVVSAVEQFQFFDGTRDWGNLTSGSGDGVVQRGTVGNDTMFGSPGYDTLYGGEGDDTVYGGTGNDVIYGESGNDTITGGAGDDSIEGNGGFDLVRFSGNFAEYNIMWLAATRQYKVVDTVAGRDGTDVVGSVELFQFFDGNRDWSNLTVGSGDGVTLVGTAGVDSLQGGVGYDKLSGRDGDDYLWGQEGGDQLFGENGNDRLTGGAGDDLLDGGAGIDTADFFGGTSVTVDLRITTAQNTGVGSDTIVGIEDLSGSWVGDVLIGNSGANRLFGYAGDDTLDGGLGNDRLAGSAGADQFVFSTALGPTNVDVIEDFDASQDKVVLSNAIFTTLAVGNLAADAFEMTGGTAASRAETRILLDTFTGGLYYDADGSGSQAAVQFATFDPNPFGTFNPLTEASFLII